MAESIQVWDDSAAPDEPGLLGTFAFGAVVSLATWGVFVALHVGGRVEDDIASVYDILDTSTMVLAVVVGGLCLLRWRFSAEVRDLVIALGLVVLGGVHVGFDELVVPRLSASLQDEPVIHAVAPTGFVVGVVLMTLPVLPLHPSLRERLRRIAPGAAAWLAVTAVATLVLTMVTFPSVAAVLAGRRDLAVPSGPQALAHAAVGLVLLLLAGRFATQADPAERPFFVWLALTLGMFTQSRFALALTFTSGTLWLAASRILRFEGMLFALLGVHRELAVHGGRQARALRQAHVRVESIERQRAAERQALEERRHDVRSALFAIGGVAELLHRRHDDLDTGTVEALTQALGAEVTRLQELVAEREREPLEPFSLLDALEPLIVLERSNGRDVTCLVPSSLRAVGRPTETAQVVRNLLDNAARYAPGSPVTVRAERREEWVVVIVEDAGPGVPPAERRAVFERSRRGSTSEGTEGSGLGLYVGSRLMREQGGDLLVTEGAGGGAAFVFNLPAAPSSEAGAD